MQGSKDRSTQRESASSAGTTDTAHLGVLLDLLLTVSYVDGPLHPRERQFIQQFVDSALLLIEQSAAPDAVASVGAEWRAYLESLYRHLDNEVAELARNAPALGGVGDVAPDLRARALNNYVTLPAPDQEVAMELVHGLINVDGEVTPPEQTLYDQLLEATETRVPATPEANTAQMQALADPEPAGYTPGAAIPLRIAAPVRRELTALSDPLLDPLEHTLSPHPKERKSQIDWDYRLIQSAITQWQKQRAAGNGRLAGLSVIDQLSPGASFLDDCVYVLRPDHPVELVVLGDLHGCYSCLKAALLQSNFVERAWAHQWDPERFPDVKLVLLGDYIDRGLFSFDGVLRAVLHLFVSMPDQVYVLRGNHEHLRWRDNHIRAVVHPAEALASIAPHVPVEMLEGYRVLFEHMPGSLLCDRTLFVHAGIPREDTFEARYRDLSSLNEPALRFQMAWSDPVQVPRVPLEEQRQNPRFNFGYDQFRAFMDRTGLCTLVRGHEKIDSGFEVIYDNGDHRLLNLFSAGGHDNCDLPAHSSYRTVTPMALTIRYGDGAPTATPWPLHYHAFNYPPHNGLYRPHPLLRFRYV